MQHFLAVVVLAAACGGSGAAPVANTPTGPIASPPQPPASAVLQALQNGDRACYVVVRVGSEEQSLEGDFDLCEGGAKDATALIGKPVTYTTKKAKVLAASCEGDMDCGKSDEVDLVVTLEAAP